MTVLGASTAQYPSPWGSETLAERAKASSNEVLPWSELWRRVFSLDVLVREKGLGPMTVSAYLTDP